ncbi:MULTISPECIES: pentapeptide repeat-containing protein [unclassified Streptomyces]|uniref:pentapeptide repeat-containing protein n=1 Tax=unclassified Streptomyces TaxID=2593676 RepID=UPI002E812301|nr:pentapeptide repeat-containing protein [Streptomyces sp. NBC_00589]WTI37492.1 pentapeptide repeat-containing protein [Streptomyces sp. NBC_00775]WUB28830.1 pentapeptide repeat-containing protein [Streptomyces sp. NBC_00589]
MHWVGLVAVSLPGLAALAALLFTWMQVGQSSKELRISEQGQITNRFNAAITNLGSQSVDMRLGGIYALQRIMEDSSRDHLTVISVLAAYVRQHAPIPVSGAKQTEATSTEHSPPTDVQAAINVVGNGRDSRSGEMVDLSRTNLRRLKPMGMSRYYNTAVTNINFHDVVLEESDLSGAELSYVDFRHSDMRGANLSVATLYGAKLHGTDLSTTNLAHARLCALGTTNGRRWKVCADLSDAVLTSANLTGADLPYVNLTKANLTAANLTGANLTGANLTGANLTGANLDGAKLDGAKLDGVRGLPSSRR